MGTPFTAISPPEQGRRFWSSRRVRLGDVTPQRHTRLDALARYLQDVAADDVVDAGIDGEAAWVVRRTTLEVVARPLYQEMVGLTTWCSGTGGAWAERRTTIAAGGRTLVEASSLWVCLDPVTLRPAALAERFFTVYGRTRLPRPARPRLRLPALPPAGAPTLAWPLRPADFDVLGHVNNAIAWTALEQEVSRIAPDRSVIRAEVEYRRPIDGGNDLGVVSTVGDGAIGVWLLDGSGATAVVAALAVLPTPRL